MSVGAAALWRRLRRGSHLTWLISCAILLAGSALTVAVPTGTLPLPGVAFAALPADDRPDPLPEIVAPISILPAQELSAPATAEHPAYYLAVPAGPAMPRTALVVLHGMGGSGPGMAELVRSYAESQNLVVIAPTIPYGDWRDPAQLVSEEARLLPQLATLLDSVPAETGVQLASRVELFGFSRGAQAALRFSLLYPERVQAVAGLSAGTYTLPVRAVKTDSGATLDAPLPYGVSDMERVIGRGVDVAGLTGVRFLIAVGAADNREGDVPRQWDAFIGKTRVERAERFAETLRRLGVSAECIVVPGAGHEVNGQMLQQVLDFMTAVAAEAERQEEAAATAVPITPVAIVSRTTARPAPDSDRAGI